MVDLHVRAWLAVLLAGALWGCKDDGTSQYELPVCAAALRACAQGCVDVQTNPAHCGGCGIACGAGQTCQAGVCTNACPQGQAACGAACADLTTHPAHCGGCNNACPAGQLCVRGGCSATCDQTVCTGTAGPVCVSLGEDEAHCGTCNNACTQAESCIGGQCTLNCGALTACNRACVDTRTDAAHCGSCGNACPAGTACANGVCTCSSGLAACGNACVDTATDPAHCGSCGNACSGGYACEGGECVGPGGCSETPVTGLSLSAIDAYQTVQIPIMDEGQPIQRGARNADVVVGRKTVFRVHVRPEAGWAPREVSARIELTDAPQGPKQAFFGMARPAGASSDADLGSTFQIEVPAEAIKPGTQYAVTLLDCGGGAAPGAPGASRARFPSDGFAELGARETGPIKIHIVPISGTSVTEAALQPFKERVEAVYPITEVQFTIGSPLTSAAGSMCSLLASVTSRRSQDRPPNDVYYYGLAPGILGGQSGCSNTSTSAQGSKVSAGWAQGYRPDDGRTGAATMCHELGHAHGRFHAPCNVSDPDRRYPYPNADIGVWAYDRRTNEFYEPSRKDMMSYCPEPRWSAWISDYNYQALLERAAQVNAQAEIQPFVAGGERETSWRLLVSDSAGLHWVEEPLLVRGTPEGQPERAVVHGERGAMQEVEVYVRPLEDGVGEGAFMLTLPEPDASWRAIEVPGLLALQQF